MKVLAKLMESPNIRVVGVDPAVADKLTEIDAWIDASSDNWRISRMAVIDRNVLRIAATELRWIEDIPPRVAIDEAIEIVRRFSTEKSATFVNGILDRLLKDAEQEDGSR